MSKYKVYELIKGSSLKSKVDKKMIRVGDSFSSEEIHKVTLDKLIENGRVVSEDSAKKLKKEAEELSKKNQSGFKALEVDRNKLEEEKDAFEEEKAVFEEDKASLKEEKEAFEKELKKLK